MASIILTSLVVVINLPFLFRYRTIKVINDDAFQPNVTSLVTNRSSRYDVAVRDLWKIEMFVSFYRWLTNVLFYMVPLLVLFILNSFIIRALWRTRQHQRKFPARRRITIMLVTVTLVFMVCVTPDAVMSTIFGFGYTDSDYLVRGVREITDLLVTANSAIDFLLYCSFHEAFRQHFTGVLKCCNIRQTHAYQPAAIIQTKSKSAAPVSFSLATLSKKKIFKTRPKKNSTSANLQIQWMSTRSYQTNA